MFIIQGWAKVRFIGCRTLYRFLNSVMCILLDAESEICPASDNYLKFNGVNVKLGDNAKSYVAAGEDCRSSHGYLAKISSEQELKALEFLKGK